MKCVCGKPAVAWCGGCKEAAYCSVLCQSRDWAKQHQRVCSYLLIENKRPRQEEQEEKEEIAYWRNNGAYQEMFDFMMEALGLLVPDENYRQWYERDENEMWRFFNAMAGIYYERQNSGSRLKGAIENGRTPGVNSRADLLRLAVRLRAPQQVRNFIQNKYPSDQDYETMMDETILFVEERLFKHKNMMMLTQLFQQKGLGKTAATALARQFFAAQN